MCSHQSSFNGYTQQKEHWGLQGSTPQTTACILQHHLGRLRDWLFCPFVLTHNLAALSGQPIPWSEQLPAQGKQQPSLQRPQTVF